MAEGVIPEYGVRLLESEILPEGPGLAFGIDLA